ncbi:MAG TPA: ParB N-terminal domain-containing protein [Gemmatimonadaceae bacterium]
MTSSVEFDFTVRGARQAAAAGRIDDWVHSYLTESRGANVLMAAGLRLQTRWWLGPTRVKLDLLRRVCGPEPEMEYRTSADAWETKVSAMAAAIIDPEALPPLILEYRGDYLELCDGNHRHEALRRRGVKHVWALVWCNSEDDVADARATLFAHR